MLSLPMNEFLQQSFKEIGIGYYVAGNVAYWVQDFGAR